MYTDEICAAAAALGSVSAENISAAAEAAEAELTAKLKDGISISGISGEFVIAAAMLALSINAASSSADGVTEYSAGEVTVKHGAADAERAGGALRDRAFAILAPYLKDDGFSFMGVDG